MPTISLVIASYNRAPQLERCLHALRLQHFGVSDEIVVADNGSTDDTQNVLARVPSELPVPLRTVFEPTPGKSHAIDAALRVARGEVLVFIDDDVLVSDHWLEALRNAFENEPSLALAGGPVDPHWEARPPRWLSLGGHTRLGAPLGLLDYGPTPQALGPRTLLGANLAVRRRVLTELGGYAAHLGKLRGTLLSGEDHELCARIQAAGHRAVYLPHARVRHLVPASRMRVSYFLRWFFWSGITNAAIEGMEARHARRRVPAHALRQFAAGATGALASAARGQLAAAVDRALDSAFAAGYVAARTGLVRTAPRIQAGRA